MGGPTPRPLFPKPAKEKTMIHETLEGLPDIEALAIITVDGSATMSEIERVTGVLKHLRTAWLFQQVLDRMDDPQYEFAFVTGCCFSADSTGVKVLSLLEEHNPYVLKTYTGNTDLIYWDPLSMQHRQQGMGNMTPIGSALAWARERAEHFVNASDGQVLRRAVIFLLSDGKNNYGPDGMDEKAAIQAFNASSRKGYIRLATIGYYQLPEGESPEEDAGRRLLRTLPLNEMAYFESDNVEKIVPYIISTITQVMKQAA
jgi:hypothetical protein